MPVPGADSAIHNRVLTTTLSAYGKEISNEIARNDGIIGIFGAKDRIEIVTGGANAKEILDVSENPNFDTRSIYSDAPVGRADTRKIAQYGWATIDGVVAINKIEENMNAGSAKIFDIAEAEMTNAKNTIIRKIADKLRATTPTDSDPESIKTIIVDTAVAGQTTTTGELSRSTNSWWRSQYDNTSAALNSAAGLQVLEAFILQFCTKGSSNLDQPDFGLTTGTLFAALSAGLGDNLKMYQPDAKVMALGFTTIKVLNALIMVDTSMDAGDVRLINTNSCHLKVLRSSNMKDIGSKAQTLPFTFEPFLDDDRSPHRTAFGYLTFALTCSSLQRQGIQTNCS